MSDNSFRNYITIGLFLLFITGCGMFKRKEVVDNSSDDKFFLNQKDDTEHGKKGKLDRIYQLDPGGDSFEFDERFLTDPPHRIAVLPFENLIGGNLILNGFPIPRPDEESEEEWNWTYANRLRTYFYGHLVPREFEDEELFEIDAVLQALGIDSPEKLYNYSPQILGHILGADALIYGKVTKYDSSYYAVYSQIAIGLAVKCVSTSDGSILFEANEIRHANEIRVATNPLDFIIASVQNGIALRDVYRSRASEEVCREIVLRIPVVKSLKEEKEAWVKERIKLNIPDEMESGYFDPFEKSILGKDGLVSKED